MTKCGVKIQLNTIIKLIWNRYVFYYSVKHRIYKATKQTETIQTGKKTINNVTVLRFSDLFQC